MTKRIGTRAMVLPVALGLIWSVVTIGAPSDVEAPDGSLDFRHYFEYQPLAGSYAAPAYSLPLSASSIANYRDLTALQLAPEANDIFLKNGFVVTDFNLVHQCEDVAEAYEALAAHGVPILVTSASLLHTYHVLFDYTLSSIEAQYLYDALWTMSVRLFEQCSDVYRSSSGDAKEAAGRDATFLAVGLSLLQPQASQAGGPSDGARIGGPQRPGDNRSGQSREFTSADLATYRFEVPAEFAAVVKAERDLIAKHAGFASSPLVIYAEDYSQYVPRGHYTISEKLKSYFRAMMWFGRMTMLLKGSADIPAGTTCFTCDALISEYDARIQTMGACLIARLMGDDKNLTALWGQVYRATAFFVGFSDDLGPYQYLEAMNRVFGGSKGVPDPALFGDPAKQGALKARLAEYRSARIYGGTGDCALVPPFTPDQADECLDKTRGFRFMGQRFVPDSYILSKLVNPYTGPFTGTGMPFTVVGMAGVGKARGLPRGLDVLAVLGSDRARAILDDLGDSKYENFDKAFAQIKTEIDQLKPADWNQNLYWNWLWVLKALLNQHGPGFPAFMASDAWRTRLVTLGLASWAELRHDTILYAKQSYTIETTGMVSDRPTEAPKVTGYVEPVPEVYNRLLSLTRMMRNGLKAMTLITDRQAASLVRLEDALTTLIRISTGELNGEALTEQDLAFIRGFGGVLGGVFEGLDARSKRTVMVADVHTDANSGVVLEEACGHLDILVTAMRIGRGTYAAAGPELSYFEFKQPMGDRLTDEAWTEMLISRPPAAPPWTTAYVVRR
ncbi:MAG: DUF3160 domain-containing protein [Candidatus Eisenbacteria bacterium]